MKRFRRSLVVGLATVAWDIFSPSFVGAQANLENPAPNSFQSGIGIVSGWKCLAGTITVSFDGGAPIQVAYGTSRGDTRSVCGDDNNGFGLLWNWNLLRDGTHTVRVFDNNVEFASATFTVTTFGVEFLRGASGQFPLQGFPRTGTVTRVRWQESSQTFVIDQVTEPLTGGILFSGVTSQGATCNAAFNPTGSCHARFNMTSARDLLSPSPLVDEVITQHPCASGAALLFVARCDSTIIGFLRCTSVPVANGHWEVHPKSPTGVFSDIVADCAGNTCSGTFRTNTNDLSCTTDVLTWTATAIAGNAAMMEEDAAPVMQPERELHEEKGLQLEIGEDGEIHFTIPDADE